MMILPEIRFVKKAKQLTRNSFVWIDGDTLKIPIRLCLAKANVSYDEYKWTVRGLPANISLGVTNRFPIGANSIDLCDNLYM
jgi:hypothetical protein